MSIFSDIYRYREAGDQTNENTVAEFGQPKKSLFTSSKFWSLHHQIDVTNEEEQVMYQARSKAISLHDKTEITDAKGNFVSHIERKVLSIHQKHMVTMADGTEFDLSTEILHIIKDVINIEGLGWQIRGDILALTFEVYDSDGSIIAVIGQKLLSLHDKYCIDIYKPEYEQIVVTLLITLQHIIRDREVSSSSTIHSSSTTSN